MSFVETIEDLYETNKFGAKYVRYDRRPSEALVAKYQQRYGINTDCHNICKVCQITHIDKYKETLELENAKSLSDKKEPMAKWFKPNCSFIKAGWPTSFIQPRLEQLIKEGIPAKRAKRILFSTIDPINWLELLMGFDDETQLIEDIERHWYLRWYQKAAIRCTAKRLVLRAGRRTGKSTTAALKIIDWVFNHKVFAARDADGVEKWTGPKILIITPFQSQVTTIFSEIERLLLINEALVKEVIQTGSKLFKQSPPLTMIFQNGAIIEGHVTGANDKEDGSGGGSIRGNYAHFIYIDEQDMVPEYIMKNVIKPLLMSRPNTGMLCSSTPIGKKGSFYTECLEDPTWKEFYFPGTVLPHWDMQEAEILQEGTQDSFKAEYMAQFNVDSYGAFKNKDVIAARSNYTYEETNDPAWWSKGTPFRTNYHAFSICIGIDWNKNVGTEMSVTAFDPRNGVVYTLENYLIEPSEYSGAAYKDAVKQLNFKWKPKYIYCDEGYGHTLYEDLQLESMNIAAKGAFKSDFEKSVGELGSKLRKINFSSNLEIFNPATGTYEKKYAKNFLVENAISIFERRKILFSETDTVLIKQLQNYVQVSKHDSGKIVYGMINERIGDHRLDALMLSLGGLVLEEGVFSYSSYNRGFEAQHVPMQSEVDPDLNASDNLIIDGKGQLVGFKNQNNVSIKEGPDGSASFQSIVFGKGKRYNHDAPNSRNDISGKSLFGRRSELQGATQEPSIFEKLGFVHVENHSNRDDVGEDPLPGFRPAVFTPNSSVKGANRRAAPNKVRRGF